MSVWISSVCLRDGWRDLPVAGPGSDPAFLSSFAFAFAFPSASGCWAGEVQSGLEGTLEKRGVLEAAFPGLEARRTGGRGQHNKVGQGSKPHCRV